jgi:hypothetical protein
MDDFDLLNLALGHVNQQHGSRQQWCVVVVQQALLVQ